MIYNFQYAYILLIGSSYDSESIIFVNNIGNFLIKRLIKSKDFLLKMFYLTLNRLKIQ